MNRNIPAHFDALFDTVEGAVILAQTIWLKNLVGDAQIIAASKEAAELYGYNYPSELEGKFTSELDHPDDYLAIKAMSVSRMYGLGPVPNEYDVRIILPGGDIRYIRKSVRQIEHDNSTYWMSRSVKISPDEAQPLPDFRWVLTPDALRRWFGSISIYELSKFIEQYTPVRNKLALQGDLTMPEFQSIMDAVHANNLDSEDIGRIKNVTTAVIDEVINIPLGQTRRLPDNRFIHRCGNCAETWASSVRNPPQCPRSREDSRGSKCGTRRWRLVTNRGESCAAHQTEEFDVGDHSK